MIAAIRKSKRITQMELANAAGVSQPFIHDLENGNRSAKPETLERIAAALGCTVDDLLTEVTEDGASRASSLPADAKGSGAAVRHQRQDA